MKEGAPAMTLWIEMRRMTAQPCQLGSFECSPRITIGTQAATLNKFGQCPLSNRSPSCAIEPLFTQAKRRCRLKPIAAIAL